MNSPINYADGVTSRIIVLREDRLEHPTTATPVRLYEFWKQVIETQPDHEFEKETCVVALLDTRMVPYAWHRISIGSVNEAICHPREVFRPVIAGAAAHFALMHNHPSGDPTPSLPDEAITRNLVQASEIMRIRMLDHVIVGTEAEGRNPYYSFREGGLIP